MMQRLGLNCGKYCGEQIKIGAVLEEIDRLATSSNWVREPIFTLGEFEIFGYHWSVTSPRKRLYISTGIHGDEPAGPLAIHQLFASAKWPADMEIWLCPCLNPTGFVRNTRENEIGIDLNRDYRHLMTAEIRGHVAWLRSVPRVDLAVILHEDWEANGFYLYELNRSGKATLSETIIDGVREVFPIENAATVDSWDTENGVIRPQVPFDERPQWPEAIYLVSTKTDVSYTLETPSDFPLQARVAAHARALETILGAL
ncbi:MAG: M14 family metallocarboxypeptidase [Verrucomicrobiota bacterium]|nr:M14 family metallocarboxypeptidase [Verrucomicrobiota bacterium]